MCYHMLPRGVVLPAMIVLPYHSPISMEPTLNCSLWQGAKQTILSFKLACIDILTQQWKGISVHWLHGEAIEWVDTEVNKLILRSRSRVLNNGNSQGRGFNEERGDILGEGPSSTCGAWGGQCLCWQMLLTGLGNIYSWKCVTFRILTASKEVLFFFLLRGGVSGNGVSTIKYQAQCLVPFNHILWLNMEPNNCLDSVAKSMHGPGGNT